MGRKSANFLGILLVALFGVVAIAVAAMGLPGQVYRGLFATVTPALEAVPSVTPTGTAIPTPTETLAPVTAISPTEIVEQAVPHNAVPDGVTDPDVLMRIYYEPAPERFYGTGTLLGSYSYGLDQLRYVSQAAVWAWERHGYSLMGQGYGFVRDANADEQLIENPSSLEDFAIPDVEIAENARRLITLGSLDWPSFMEYVRLRYAGIVAMKSPNDLGREFCVYNAYAGETPLGTVIVGDTSARHDWWPVLPDGTWDFERASVNHSYSPDGRVWRWGADVTQEIYNAGRWDWRFSATYLLFVEGRCDETPGD